QHVGVRRMANDDGPRELAPLALVDGERVCEPDPARAHRVVGDLAPLEVDDELATINPHDLPDLAVHHSEVVAIDRLDDAVSRADLKTFALPWPLAWTRWVQARL